METFLHSCLVYVVINKPLFILVDFLSFFNWIKYEIDFLI